MAALEDVGELQLGVVIGNASHKQVGALLVVRTPRCQLHTGVASEIFSRGAHGRMDLQGEHEHYRKHTGARCRHGWGPTRHAE
eukprot:CAMPEP_0203901916 /NCGR_PEP_ID=MMETSP0359-20131031/44008_1 /ASSEMBLY_ACC=CAM_ASM_000338 /TAXON_ID=268821 /ORGANISM="Scrippsiella Hangoei, Strain SHTV-5" /LENGTH=82 /DNA_ID=CAMNT_0050825643 /DNA_START=1054 /DNA_END=1299 /DNA_ORIENTATION=+